MNIFVHIGARGGSKELKNKNTLKINGIPLIGWTLKQIVKSKISKNIMVSSDSTNILSISKTFGANILHKREKNLSNSKISKFSVWKDSVQYLKKFYNLKENDLFLDFDCTCPLRNKRDIFKIIKSFKKKQKNKKFDGLMTTTIARKNPYFNLVEKNSKGFLKLSKVLKRKIYTRQDAPKVLEHVASMYALKPNFIIKKKNLMDGNLLDFNVSLLSSLDIDTKDDLILIRALSK